MWESPLVKLLIPSVIGTLYLTFTKLAVNEIFLTLETIENRFSLMHLILTVFLAITLGILQGSLLGKLNKKYDHFTMYCGYYIQVAFFTTLIGIFLLDRFTLDKIGTKLLYFIALALVVAGALMYAY